MLPRPMPVAAYPSASLPPVPHEYEQRIVPGNSARGTTPPKGSVDSSHPSCWLAWYSPIYHLLFLLRTGRYRCRGAAILIKTIETRYVTERRERVCSDDHSFDISSRLRNSALI